MKSDVTEEKNIEKKQKENNKELIRKIDKKGSTKVFANLIVAILVMAYFCAMAIVYNNVHQDGIISVVKVSTLVFLAIALVLIELAYKKESKTFLIHAFEILALAVHSLTTMHVIKIYNFDFKNYIVVSSYIFAIYYVLKTIIINTKVRKQYLKNLSDITDIVKKDEPKKKEAIKKEKNYDEKEEVEEAEIEENKDKQEDEKKEILEDVKAEPIEENKKFNNNKLAAIRARLKELQKQDEENKKIIKNEKKEDEQKEDIKENEEKIQTEIKENEELKQEPAKRKRGRPRKNQENQEDKVNQEKPEKKVKTESKENKDKNEEQENKEAPKRKRGRPKKEVKKDD